MSFDDKLRAAKGIVRTQDVPVLLDADLAEERDALIEAIGNASEESRLTRASKADQLRAQLEALQERVADAVTVLRFRRLPGRVWGDLASAHPPRDGYDLDRLYGYNIEAVCVNAILYRRTDEDGEPVGPAYAFRVEDDTEVVMTEDQWFDLLDVISGGEFREVCLAILSLNVLRAQEQRQAAVKALGATARSATK